MKSIYFFETCDVCLSLFLDIFDLSICDKKSKKLSFTKHNFFCTFRLIVGNQKAPAALFISNLTW